uniref:Uncharacterized protein n=1 Tax=Chenopodium quinoa TaxID=63459 RepID=A0A803N8L8_CHEQI
MALKAKGKQLSFEILSSNFPVYSDDTIIDRSYSDPLPQNNKSNRRRRKRKRKKSTPNSPSPFEFNTIFENGGDGGVAVLEEEPSMTSHSYSAPSFVVCEMREESLSTVCQVSQGELRQRSFSSGGSGGGDSIPVVEVSEAEANSNSRPNLVNGKLDTAESLDWSRFMAEEDPNFANYWDSPRSTEVHCSLLIQDSDDNLGIQSSKQPQKADKPKTPSAAELSDFGCLFVLAVGVTLLGRTDISLIYHMIRGQGIIKLYVVYNVLEFLGFSHAEASHENEIDELAIVGEIKSNVFKRFSKDNVHSIVYSDSIERFHITAFVIFVLAQNIQEAEGPWFGNFFSNALLVYFSEMAVDVIKHSFIAKFNDIKPIVYSEFLEDLCKQTLNIQTDGEKKTLTFVPVAPACVVSSLSFMLYLGEILPIGHQGAHPCICCSSSLQSSGLETFLDVMFDNVDLCDACEPEGDDRDGASKACSLVHQKVPEEETSL